MAEAPKRKSLQKVNSGSTTGGKIFYCSRCGAAYSRLKGYFPVSHSPMYRGIGHLPFCNDCIDDMYDAYRTQFGNDRDAMRRICMKLDLYWNNGIYDMVERSAGVHSRIRSYIGKTNIVRYIDKTFDDTLAEEAKADLQTQTAEVCASVVTVSDDGTLCESPEAEIVVAPEVVGFWGSGFTPDTYSELEQKYKAWTDTLGTLDPAEQAIYKQICILEHTINRDSAAGKPIDKHVNALNTLLGSANLKPAQKKQDENDYELDNMPFGVGIRKWENTRPIPEPDPELQDVDKIIRYIEIWFKGHLAKMLGINNAHSKLYEDEMAKLRVERPEYEDEDDEGLFENIFSSDGEPDEQ